MELNAAGDPGTQQVQYLSAEGDGSEQPQYIIQQEDAGAAVDPQQQQLIQGAKIVDGQIVLPQHYVTDSGETVILVYETPDGQQQFMTEDGQQIVFEQEGGMEGALMAAGQMAPQIQEQDQQQYTGEEAAQLMVPTEQAQVSTGAEIAPGQSLLAAGITMASDAGAQIAPGQSLLAPNTAALLQQQQQQQQEAAAMEGVESAEAALLDPNAQAQTTIVSDPSQIAAMLANQNEGMQVISGPGTEGMTILSQAVSAIEQGEAAASQPQISVQTLPQQYQQQPTVKYENYELPADDMDASTTLMADGKEIQVRVLSNPDFAAAANQDNQAAPLETLKLRSDIKSEEPVATQQAIMSDGSMQLVANSAAAVDGTQQQFVTKTEGQGNQVLMTQDESGAQTIVMMEGGQVISEAQVVKGENGEQIVFTNADANSQELAQFIERIKQQGGAVTEQYPGTSQYGDVKQEQMQGLVIADTSSQAQPDVVAFGPGVINPETGLMEEPDENAFTQKESDQVIYKMAGNHAKQGNEVKLQMEVFKEGSNKAEVTILSVPVQPDGQINATEALEQAQVPQQPGEGSDDSDFDEENLTPKVVYERLLAQHRRTKECQVCGELLENFLRLKEHLMEHAGYNPCECQKCGRILSTPEGRYRHEKAHDTKNSPSKIIESPRDKQVSCPVCGKQIARKEHLKRHMLIHQDCPTYKCLLCGYSFKREDLIKGHVKKFHPKQVQASSLELLFEKSTDDTAPQRSQWNPHRVYRSTPKPVRVPGRGRGRPRKNYGLESAMSPNVMDKYATTPASLKSKLPKTDRLIIRAGDGSIIVPKDEKYLPPPPAVEVQSGAEGRADGAMETKLKTTKRYIDDEEYDEEAFSRVSLTGRGDKPTGGKRRFIDEVEYDEEEFLSTQVKDNEVSDLDDEDDDDDLDLDDDLDDDSDDDDDMDFENDDSGEDLGEVDGDDKSAGEAVIPGKVASPVKKNQNISLDSATESDASKSTKRKRKSVRIEEPIRSEDDSADESDVPKEPITKRQKAMVEAKAKAKDSASESDTPKPPIKSSEKKSVTASVSKKTAEKETPRVSKGMPKIAMKTPGAESTPKAAPESVKKRGRPKKQKVVVTVEKDKSDKETENDGGEVGEDTGSSSAEDIIVEPPKKRKEPKTPKSVLASKAFAKKANKIVNLSPNNTPLWSKKKKVTVSFIGVGEEMKDYELQAIRPSKPVDIEEEIVVVMGKPSKGGSKVTTVKQVTTKTPGKRGRPPGPSTPSVAKVTPAPREGKASPSRDSTSATAERSRSGRFIKRKVAPDGEEVEMPKSKPEKSDTPAPSKRTEPPTPLKDLRVQLENVANTPSHPEGKRGRGRPRKTPLPIKPDPDQEYTPSDTPVTSRKRFADQSPETNSKLKKMRRKAIVISPYDQPLLTSAIKTVKVSAPTRNFALMRMLPKSGSDESPSRDSMSSQDEDLPKTNTKSDSKSVTKNTKNANTKSVTKSSNKIEVISLPNPSTEPTEITIGGDGDGDKSGSNQPATYGTVTIEKGRIVGEITIGQKVNENQAPQALMEDDE